MPPATINVTPILWSREVYEWTTYFSGSCEENLLSKVKVSNLQREEKINSEFRVLGKAVRGASQESRERTECYECNWIWFIVHSTGAALLRLRVHWPRPGLRPCLAWPGSSGPERETRLECGRRNDNNNHNPCCDNNLRNLDLHAVTIYSTNYFAQICTQDNNTTSFRNLVSG